ncbi:Flp pilus assembly protein CpaB [Blastococcus sp. SYSU D01042]
MPRRLLAATAAVLLALTGAFVLISYANGADARARADEDLVSVLVVDAEVPAGTPASGLSTSTVEVPSRLVSDDAVTDLATLGERVSATVLLPGEQLRTARFTDASRVADPGTVAAPEGMVEVSVTLDGQRAVAGAVRPGDKVGVQLTSQEAAGAGVDAYSVFRVFHGVLVTRVAAPENVGDPTASYLITLAMQPADAEVFVLGSSATSVYLSLEERSGAAEGDTTTTVSMGADQ